MFYTVNPGTEIICYNNNQTMVDNDTSLTHCVTVSIIWCHFSSIIDMTSLVTLQTLCDGCSNFQLTILDHHYSADSAVLDSCKCFSSSDIL